MGRYVGPAANSKHQNANISLSKFDISNSGTNTCANVYQGNWAIASTIGADGGLDFMAPASSSTNGYTTLRFALKAFASGQQYEVYIDTT